jgi:signal transduction histidine kinase/ActR/RegA family two-component response regulator
MSPAASHINRQPERVALREAARAELIRTGFGLRFREPLQGLFDADQTPGRVQELWQIVQVGAAVNAVLVLVFNLLVVHHPNLPDLAWQVLLGPAVSVVTALAFFRPGTPPAWREGAVTVNCLAYTLSVIVSIYISPTSMILIDLTLVTLPVLIVLFIARLPFGWSVLFTAASAAGLVGLVAVFPGLPATVRAYPVVFLLAVSLPALLGVYRLESANRRIWLLCFLQSLQIDDLASENSELSARAEAERRAAEERLRQAQKMEAVGQLTGGIAHDFNNLLTTVIGSLELIRGRGRLSKAADALAANALGAAERGAKLTGQLLAFSRRQRLAPASLMPAEVVAGIGNLLQGTVSEAIALNVAASAPDQWPVLADRNQLEMTVLNLVINARDAIGERAGNISIGFSNLRLTAANADKVNGAALPRGDYSVITVTDDGRGMSPDVLARACEPFFTTKQVGSGTGLGLSQAYGFASQSGGTLLLESKEGAGTKATIVLPRALASAEASGPLHGSVRPGRGETILVAEDDALVRDTIAESLRDLGYKVLRAGDGGAALRILEAGTAVDLLFTDVTMPGPMNGVDLALAARQRDARLKILFTTGYSERNVLAQWKEPLDVLQKPFNQDELARRVAKCLQEVEPALR